MDLDPHFGRTLRSRSTLQKQIRIQVAKIPTDWSLIKTDRLRNNGIVTIAVQCKAAIIAHLCGEIYRLQHKNTAIVANPATYRFGVGGECQRWQDNAKRGQIPRFTLSL